MYTPERQGILGPFRILPLTRGDEISGTLHRGAIWPFVFLKHTSRK